MTVGKKLKEARLASGLSFREIADRTGVSKTTIGRIEKEESNPHEATVKVLSAVYGVAWEWFYREGDQEQTIAEAAEAYTSANPDPFAAAPTDEEEADLVREIYLEAHPEIKLAVKSALRAGLSFREKFGD